MHPGSKRMLFSGEAAQPRRDSGIVGATHVEHGSVGCELWVGGR